MLKLLSFVSSHNFTPLSNFIGGIQFQSAFTPTNHFFHLARVFSSISHSQSKVCQILPSSFLSLINFTSCFPRHISLLHSYPFFFFKFKPRWRLILTCLGHTRLTKKKSSTPLICRMPWSTSVPFFLVILIYVFTWKIAYASKDHLLLLSFSTDLKLDFWYFLICNLGYLLFLTETLTLDRRSDASRSCTQYT